MTDPTVEQLKQGVRLAIAADTCTRLLLAHARQHRLDPDRLRRRVDWSPIAVGPHGEVDERSVRRCLATAAEE